MDWLGLCVLAFLAGLVDSMAGGGGLIQLPALFLFLPGTLSNSVALVLGTNKFASICGTGLAAARYSQHIAVPWRTVIPASASAFLLSGCGAFTVGYLSNRFMKPMILILLILMAVYTAWKKNLGHRHNPRFTAAWQPWIAVIMGAVIGFYDGFFGPGTGSFLMFGFISLFGFEFLVATAATKIINLATNAAAILIFASQHQILYHYAIPMGLCNIAGAFVGTHWVMQKGNRLIRVVFLAVVTSLILKMGWDNFFQSPAG